MPFTTRNSVCGGETQQLQFHHGLASHRESAVSKASSTSSTPPFEQPEFSPEAGPSQSMYMPRYPGQELVPYSQQSTTVLHAGKRFPCCLYREWNPLLVDPPQ